MVPVRPITIPIPCKTETVSFRMYWAMKIVTGISPTARRDAQAEPTRAARAAFETV